MLLDQIRQELAVAQKSKDQLRVDTLRFLLGAIHNVEIDKKNLEEIDVIAVIKKQIKSHEESIAIFQKANRQDLVSKEKAQLAVLQTYG